MRHVGAWAVVLAMAALYGCGGSAPPGARGPTPDNPCGPYFTCAPHSAADGLSRTNRHEMMVTRDGTTVHVAVTQLCYRQQDQQTVPCPSNLAHPPQDRIELVIASDFTVNTDTQRIPVGTTDQTGSLTFDLNQVLPNDFPKSNKFTVNVLDNFDASRQVNGNWYQLKGLCDFVQGLCTTKPLDVMDLARARSAQHRQAAIAASNAAFAKIQGDCGPTPPTVDACDNLRAWLARATDERTMYTMYGPGTLPPQDWVASARAILAQAEPALARLREARDWTALDTKRCSQANGPTADDIRQACAPLRTFLQTYPNTEHAQDVHAVLDPADKRTAALDAKEQAAAKRKADEEARQERAAEATAAAKQRQQCMGACRIKCASTPNFDQCFAGCPMVCQ